MPKSARQLDHEIATALHRYKSRSGARAHATMSKDAARKDLQAALDRYETLNQASTSYSPGHTPEAWDAVAAQIEAGVMAADLQGGYRSGALVRARDARSNAQFLRHQGGQRAHASIKRTRRKTPAHATMKEEAARQDLQRALNRYEKLMEAATAHSPGHTPEVWDAVAGQIEAGVKAANLQGTYRSGALARARDARSNAQFFRHPGNRSGHAAIKRTRQGSRSTRAAIKQPRRKAPARDLHMEARHASQEAFRVGTTEAHHLAAKAFRASARKHMKDHNASLANYQEQNAQMHDQEVKEASFNWKAAANIVRDAAQRTPRRLEDGTFDQVFVADVYRALSPTDRKAIGAPTLPQFKDLLAYLNKRQLINLSHVDDPGMWVDDGRTAKARAASYRLVEESEIDSLGAKFHVIRL